MTEILPSKVGASASLRPLPHVKQKISVVPCRYFNFPARQVGDIISGAGGCPGFPAIEMSAELTGSMKEIEQWIPNLTGILTVIVLLCSFILSSSNLRYAAEISLFDPALTWAWLLCII